MSGGITPLNAGDLNTRIELMRPSGSAVKGDTKARFEVAGSPYAEVLGQDGREAVIAQALQGISTYRIRLRWRADLNTSWQIRLGGVGGTDLNVRSVTDPNGRREQLMIIADTSSAYRTS